jgi:hypothetical protein
MKGKERGGNKEVREREREERKRKEERWER